MVLGVTKIIGLIRQTTRGSRSGDTGALENATARQDGKQNPDAKHHKPEQICDSEQFQYNAKEHAHRNQPTRSCQKSGNIIIRLEIFLHNPRCGYFFLEEKMNYKEIMPKYKIGDKVKIKSKQVLLAYPMLIDPEKIMTKYEKSIMTIRAMCGPSSYYMIEDQNDTDCNDEPGWVWDEELIEGLAEQCHINIEYDDVINFFDN